MMISERQAKYIKTLGSYYEPKIHFSDDFLNSLTRIDASKYITLLKSKCPKDLSGIKYITLDQTDCQDPTGPVSAFQTKTLTRLVEENRLTENEVKQVFDYGTAYNILNIGMQREAKRQFVQCRY